MTVAERRAFRRPKGAVLLALFVTVAGLAAFLLAVTRPGGDDAVPAAVGRPAPDFRLPDLRQGGETISLSAFQGRPVVLNFWASWCVPCRAELRDFQAAHRRLGDRVAFLGIDRQDDREEALQLLGQAGVTYPSAADREGSLDRPFGLRGMPTTVFISADGVVVDHVTGQVKASRLDDLLRRLGVE